MTTARVDHIGIIVADLERAMAKLRPLFGEPTRIKDLPEVGLKIAEFQTQNLLIELLQYANDEAGFAKGVMGERLGLNHISLRVADVDGSIAELSAAGFAPMPGFPRAGAHGRVAFFEPDALTGLLFEVCQPDAKKHDGEAD